MMHRVFRFIGLLLCAAVLLTGLGACRVGEEADGTDGTDGTETISEDTDIVTVNDSLYVTKNGTLFAPAIDLSANMSAKVLTKELLLSVMEEYKRQGWNRVYIVLENPGYPMISNPYSAPMGLDDTDYRTNNVIKNLLRLGDPNQACVEAAHKAGLEIWGVYKPYEGGGGATIPSSATAEASVSHLETVGGWQINSDQFVSQYSDYRLRRKGETDPTVGKAITKIEIAFMIDSFTNTSGADGKTDTYASISEFAFDKPSFDIYVSTDNGTYTLFGTYMPKYHTERRDICDPNGYTVLNNAKCEIAVIDQLEIPAEYPYIALVPSTSNYLRLIPQTMIRFLAADGSEALTTVSSYYRVALETSLRYGERPEDYIWGRECLPESVTTDRAATAFQNWGFEFEWRGAGFWGDGWLNKPRVLAVARGTFTYLKGFLCEGYEEVREYWLDNVKSYANMGYDGIDIRLQCHSGMISDYVNYGFNQPIIDRYLEVFGTDISNIGAVDEETAMNIMKIRGEFFMEFYQEAAEYLHSVGKKVAIHLRASYENPKLSYDYNEIGMWTMPRIIFDWKKAVDLSDEITIRDYYFNNYRAEYGQQIKSYAASLGKTVWIHSYADQGGECNYAFLSAADADPNVGGIIGYEFHFEQTQGLVSDYSYILFQLGYGKRR